MRPKCRKVTFPLICLLSECSLPSSKISSKVNDTLQLYSALLKTIKTPEAGYLNLPRVFLISRISLLGSGVPVGHGGAAPLPKRSSTGAPHRSGSDARKIPDNTAPGQK